MTFKEYIEIFFKERYWSLAPITISNYHKELEKACIKLGEKEMAEISLADMKMYFSQMQGASKNYYTSKLLKYGSVVQHYIVLHTFFKNAFEDNVITLNPMDRLKRPRPRKDEVIKDPIFYGKEKIKYILNCTENESPMWKALIYFVIDSGCRCGEVMALKWDEIDFENGTVTICRNVQYIPKKGVYICTPKNGKSRTIFVNHKVLEVLSNWKKIQESQDISRKINSNGYCFTKKDGSIMMPGCFNSYLNRFGQKYGINGLHPHALRHSMASLSIISGADIVSISKKLGHSKVSTTLNIYSHTDEEAQKKANAVLAKEIYQ